MNFNNRGSLSRGSLAVLVSVLLATLSAPALGDDGGDREGKAPTITSVLYGTDASGRAIMTINGQNLGNNAPDAVVLGAMPKLTLLPSLSPSTQITALMPATVPPGTYLLSLVGAAGSWRMSFNTEIGASGAAGPAGASGQPGPSPTVTMLTAPTGACTTMDPNGNFGTMIVSADGSNITSYVCTGATGSQGPAGPPGAISTGSAGGQGPAGPAGPAGPTGPEGTQGPRGLTGLAAPNAFTLTTDDGFSIGTLCPGVGGQITSGPNGNGGTTVTAVCNGRVVPITAPIIDVPLATDPQVGNSAIGVAGNLNLGDSFVNFTNTGSSSGNVCANVYVFVPISQGGAKLESCCSCMVKPNALASYSVTTDLLKNFPPGWVPKKS